MIVCTRLSQIYCRDRFRLNFLTLLLHFRNQVFLFAHFSVKKRYAPQYILFVIAFVSAFVSAFVMSCNVFFVEIRRVAVFGLMASIGDRNVCDVFVNVVLNFRNDVC